MTYKLSNFYFVKEAGFYDTYECIEQAMKYYYDDPGTSCGKFRFVLESVVEEIFEVLGQKSTNDSVFENLGCLKTLIPSVFFPEELLDEMHLMRCVTNRYSHKDSCGESEKDRLTCYISTLKICNWLVDFKKQYPNYLSREEEKERKKKEKRKKNWKTAGKVMGAILGVAGAIFGISQLGKKKD